MLASGSCLADQGKEIESAAALGASLTEAVQSDRDINMKKLANYTEIKRFMQENACGGIKYRAYTVATPEGDYLYIVGSKGRNVIVGRHFKVPIAQHGIDITKIKSSTKGCLDLGARQKNSAAMYVTHLQPYPNEFHVLESNLQGIALYVGTSTGMYSIESGAIRLVKEQ